jgi:hypothetical protein
MKFSLPDKKFRIWIGMGLWIILIGVLELFLFFEYPSSLISIGLTSSIFGTITGFTFGVGVIVIMLGLYARYSNNKE